MALLLAGMELSISSVQSHKSTTEADRKIKEKPKTKTHLTALNPC